MSELAWLLLQVEEKVWDSGTQLNAAHAPMLAKRGISCLGPKPACASVPTQEVTFALLPPLSFLSVRLLIMGCLLKRDIADLEKLQAGAIKLGWLFVPMRQR